MRIVTLALASCILQSVATGQVHDLGHNAIRFGASAEVVAYFVQEFIPGEPDLNGDGDRSDRVVLVVDPATGVTVNLGLAADADVQVDGRWVVFQVDEGSQGFVDRNGDGDALDDVFHVYDAVTQTVTNLGLEGSAFQLRTDVLAIGVSEAGQGAIDLDGDGDASDDVLHLVDLPTLQVRSLALATGSGTFQLGRGHVAFVVLESAQGGTDLNGDGDALDAVLHTCELTTAAVQNLGRAVSLSGGFRLDGRFLVFRVREASQSADLNGDSDMVDDVVHYQQLPGGPITNLVYATIEVEHRDSDVAFRVAEAAQGGLDLNGDGDVMDAVLFTASMLGGGSVHNLQLAAFNDYEFGGPVLLCRVSEVVQGADLNGDGDFADNVLFARHLRRDVTANLGLAVIGFVAGERVAAIRVSENSQSTTDLDGDGDTVDVVLHWLDLQTGTVSNLGLAVPGGTGFEDPDLELAPERLALLRSEPGQGIDLNGDGDTSDAVVHVVDLTTGALTNLGLAASVSAVPPGLLLRSGVLLFRVPEAAQGALDRNGDGDATDELLHLTVVGGT